MSSVPAEGRDWVRTVSNMRAANPVDFKLIKSYQGVLRLMQLADWSGACHATTAVLTVLLRAQDIFAVPTIGECITNDLYFDHSWVEIDAKVYDIAIANPLGKALASAPVYAGLSIDSWKPATVNYAVTTGGGLGSDALAISKASFAEYLSNFPGDSQGLWGTTVKVAKELGLRLNAAKLKSAYGGLTWNVRA